MPGFKCIQLRWTTGSGAEGPSILRDGLLDRVWKDCWLLAADSGLCADLFGVGGLLYSEIKSTNSVCALKRDDFVGFGLYFKIMLKVAGETAGENPVVYFSGVFGWPSMLKVDRTRLRPVASGVLSPVQGIGFPCFQLLLGLGILLQLNNFRCDLMIFVGKKSEKIASWLLEQNLKSAKDQISKGIYLITLKPTSSDASSLVQ